MADVPLHLVKVPLRTEQLATVARLRGIATRDLDDGYLAHCVLRELWQELAPQPFVLQPHRDVTEVWGYTRADASQLIDHARSYGDPTLLKVLVGIDAIASRVMPVLPTKRRVGFKLRACPVVRLAKARGDHRAGAELDAFLARCLAVGKDVAVDRESVYRDWFRQRLGPVEQSGVHVERVTVVKHLRERLVRRTQGGNREARSLARPDVGLEGELIVEDGARFLGRLTVGVGRHRAFGFGALLVVPPASSSERTRTD